RTIAKIKAADPEQDADKQIAAGDFSLMSAGASTSIYARIVRTLVESPSGGLVFDDTVVPRIGIGSAPASVQCKLPVRHVPAFAIVHGAVPSGTWCGRAALVLEDDYAKRFNKRVVEHQAYPHKDVCAVVPVGGGQAAGNIADRPTPDMIPAQIPD